MHPLIFVLYDGINNSVFQSQVLIPLQEQAKKNEQPIHIVSFERKPQNVSFPKSDTLQLHTLWRPPFLGSLSIRHSTSLLRTFLKKIPTYELVARGPLAGMICLNALEKDACKQLTIQARGLLAEEYSYTHHSFFTPLHKFWHQWRRNSLAAIEQSVYGRKEYVVPTTIEAVSAGLKEYLMETFQTPSSLITLAVKDIPETVDEHTRALWRARARDELGLGYTMKVYCYNGSIKAWQCPEMTIDFFKKVLKEDPQSFLLLLTHDQGPFKKLLQQASIPITHYRIMSVAHRDMYYYLSACDVGIVFRKPSIVNWVSRPTKVLEYRATGLKIKHNNTIQLLSS